MKVILTNEQINYIIRDLADSTGELESAIQEVAGADIRLEDISDQSLLEIDQEIFQCDTCGWWCRIEEMSENDNQVCTDCEEEA